MLAKYTYLYFQLFVFSVVLDYQKSFFRISALRLSIEIPKFYALVVCNKGSPENIIIKRGILM